MPCGYHMNLDDGLITVSGSDAENFTDLLGLGTELMADPLFDPYLPQLVDLRGIQVSRDSQSSAALRHFVLKRYRPRLQASVAVLVDDSLDSDLLARTYHLICTMDKTELFDHYDQALKWLMRQEFVTQLH